MASRYAVSVNTANVRRVTALCGVKCVRIVMAGQTVKRPGRRAFGDAPSVHNGNPIRYVVYDR